ncbi:MAG: hypothetical protein AAB409_01535 [Gemmatimonadota bacterium]
MSYQLSSFHRAVANAMAEPSGAQVGVTSSPGLAIRRRSLPSGPMGIRSWTSGSGIVRVTAHALRALEKTASTQLTPAEGPGVPAATPPRLEQGRGLVAGLGLRLGR